ncbi:UbiD family decarboxylase [Propylenella binzhouense]|uniref:UbiD family decarboxylase n=1 Tax=Propylenella binzhouense TaxID=2555902 RepID=A0A964T2A8_9HYPH|nr:UbiD family decarboxylase [Propylenella binzhouense]MYZ47116.1 UbiD family decarboxylase [Propylenella binzhouense]
MSVARKPVAFGDQRGWIDALREAGELREIGAEVDWNCELGTIVRLAQGPGDGPAMLFNNIKDYNGPESRCGQLFANGLGSYSRLAMMLGMPRETSARELVRVARTIMQERIKPVTVATGPVKDVILKGDDIDLFDFPSPHWNRVDGGRYIITYAGCVTRHPVTGVMNVGIYRGMLASRTEIPMLIWRAQHIGNHFTAYEQAGLKEMPIAFVMGWEPAMGFCAGQPVPPGVCEYDVMGGIRGEPVELVKCETVDLEVPASAEIVIEGVISTDPKDFVMEGPFAEFTGYVAGDRSPKPTCRVTCITHRNKPVMSGAIEGSLPGSYSENAVCSSIMRAGTAWNVLDNAGVPGVTDVFCPPVQVGINLLVSIKQTYRNQAKQVANAIWGSSAAHVRYKHITVVDDDIDIHDYAAVDWAIAYRVNAGEDDVIIMPSTFGAGLDPSTRRRDRNAALFGTGKWNRVLIDATINLDYDPDPDLGGARFPPTVWPSEEDEAKARARWEELGLAAAKRG